MTYGSVCSGIEAPGLAWEPLGMEALWFSEIEKFPSAVLSHHWPDVVNLGDFTSKESWGYMKDHPPDILFGGTPCQAFSVAGQRKSLDDDRGNLSLMFTELWHELRTVGTRYAVWENVPGVLNTEDNAFGCFLSGMVGERNTIPTPRSGWTNSGMVSGPEGVVAWTVKDAQHFGVPQRRRRIFAVVGHPGDFSPSEILFKPEGLSGDIATSKEAGEEVTRSVGEGFTESSFGGWKEGCGTLRSGKNGVETLVSTIGIDGEQNASVGRRISVSPCIYARASDGPRRNQGGVLAFDPRSQDGVPRISVDAREVQAPSLNTATGGQRQTCVAQYVGYRADGRNNDGRMECAVGTYYDGSDIAATQDASLLSKQQMMPEKKRMNCVIEQKAFNITFCDANGRRKDRPNGGLYVNEAEQSNTVTGTNEHTHVVGFHARQTPVSVSGKSLPLEAQGGQAVMATLDANCDRKWGSNQWVDNGFAFLRSPMVVRRLTPVECERLQGMPDNWTRIPWRGKTSEECPDGPRYKAIGNSIAVPCLRWIGERMLIDREAQ